MVTIDNYDFCLEDDGTMDTVIDVYHPRWDEPKTFRYMDTSDYRDDSGCLDLMAFVAEVVHDDAEMEE